MLKKIFSAPEKFYAGLSITASHLDYSLITKRCEQIALVDHAEFPLKNIAFTLTRIKEKVGGYPCYLALPHSFFMIKTLQFSDTLRENELIELFRLNSDRYFSCPTADIVFDLEVICKVKQKVRVLAGKKEHVEKWLRLFSSAGLNLKAISIDLLAIEQYLSFYKLIENEKTYGIFVVREQELLQIVFENSFVCFANTSTIDHKNPHFFSQEIIKFLRMYESSKIFLHPVMQLIFFGFENEAMENLKQEIPLPMVINNATHMFSIGVLLKC